MSILSSSLIAIFFSSVCLLLLIKSDDKRHRSDGDMIKLSRPLRLASGWLCALPCLVLLFFGFYSSLFIWLGAITVIGWLIAFLPRSLA